MISAHKIQERLAAYSQMYSPLPWGRIPKSEFEVLKDQENYVKRASELLGASEKFDIGEISQKDLETLYDTGKECAEAGVFSLPFEITYVEGTLAYDTVNTRFGSMFAPASSCFDGVVFEQHPEFIGGTASLSFTRINKIGPDHGSWKVPTLISVISRDFTKAYGIPAAKELTEYAAMTEDTRQRAARISVTMLYIMHSLINARGVKLLTEPAPVNLNRKRIQRNKPPLYEHHILKIGGFSSSGRVLGVGASHASPRAHWRRGHIRTIRRGTPKQKRIAIPACLISGPGFVSKDYEISR